MVDTSYKRDKSIIRKINKKERGKWRNGEILKVTKDYIKLAT